MPFKQRSSYQIVRLSGFFFGVENFVQVVSATADDFDDPILVAGKPEVGEENLLRHVLALR